MGTYCCVPQCKSWAKKNPELSFHLFPTAGQSKVIVETKLGIKELVDRRKQWIKVLLIGKKVSKFMRVCSLHFNEDDFLQKVRGQRRTLKSTAVPSQKLPLSLLPSEPVPGPSRAKRPKTIECEHDEDNQVEDSNEREAAEALIALLQSQPLEPPPMPEEINQPSTSRDIGIQVNTPQVFTLCELITTDKKLNSFTGLNNFHMFNSIVDIFMKYHKDQRTHRLNIRQRIMLLFTKFKTSLTYATLGTLFSIHPNLVKTYVFEMIPMLANVLKHLIRFPSKSEIINSMPLCFDSNFQDVRVVLDCTEILLQRPKCLCCRIRFYSQYKSHLTVKFMTGVSPGGLITFISKPYGGRASDKVMFEESGILNLLDANKDAIMVDKGFIIEDSCKIFKLKLIRPPFLRKKSQLSAEESILNKKIAASRVHIERSNQRLKIFNILSGKLNWTLLPMIEDIFIIICAVTNLSASILSDSRFLSE